MSSKLPRQLLPKADPESSTSPPLGSAHVVGEKQTKRRCISSACMPCRKRKSKCDGDKPTCTACRDVYNSDCHYDIDADHRRKGALKRDISQLTEKVSTLGAVLDAIRAGSEADVDDIIQLIRSNPDQTHENMAEMIKIMASNKHSNLTSIEPPSSLEGQLLMGLHGKAPTDKSRMNSHYGHTSNFSLHQDEERGSVTAEQVETWTTVTSDADLIKDLLDAYFSWVHPFYVMFSEELFYHGMRDRKSKYCTPLLVNAILAVACHYSDRPNTNVNSNDAIGDRFFAEAKRLLAEDDNTPSLTIVQALALMSFRQAMNNHDSSGRRYAAQMMSMTVELGLHNSHSIQAGSNLSVSEIEARRVTFWGVYVLEQIWSLCIGRIPTLPRTAIRLEKPALTPTLENTLWRPHGFPQDDMNRLTQPSFKYSILGQCGVLVEIIDDILRSFYAPRDRITSRKLQMFHEKLKDWHRRLPPGLEIRKAGATLPQVLILHIFYYNCIIQTFRPFLKVSFVQSSESPLQICTASANMISRLLNHYKDTYGTRKFYFIATHCVMTAAIIHLVNISSHPGVDDSETENYLADGIRLMYEMTQHIPITGRYLVIIKDLLHKWCKVTPRVVKEAMDQINIANIGTRLSATPSVSPPDTAPLPSANSAPNTNGASLTNNTLTLPHNRKPSLPDLLAISSSLDIPKLPASQQQNLFWTPYPESFEGVPLALQDTNHGFNNMDITNVLDSGVSGDLPQWNRDGFTTRGEDGKVWGMGVEWDGGA